MSNGGGLGIGLVNVPESFSNISNSAEWILERLTPSQTINREFQIINSTDKPMFVVVYPGAATNRNGNFMGLPKGATNELTSWTVVTPKSAWIPANSKIQGLVTVVTPSNADSSMQYGVIWAETIMGTSGNVVNINRVGIRMYDPVGDFVAPAIVSNGVASTTLDNSINQTQTSNQASTGFIVTKARSNSFDVIPMGIEWIVIGIFAVIVNRFLFKKVLWTKKV